MPFLYVRGVKGNGTQRGKTSKDRSTLQTFGYRVLVAADGTEAVAQYATNRNDYRRCHNRLGDAFMDGVATTRALRKLTPNLKIICVSGLADDAKAVEAARAGVDRFLPKPYTDVQLLRALDQLLHPA